MSDRDWVSRPLPASRIGAGGWARVALRAPALILLIYTCLLLLLLLRLIEAPLFHRRRPWTPHITCFVCRNALRIMGLRRKVHGRPMRENGAVVANHTSWLDIFTLNAGQPIYFVSKAEVAKWPGIGILARATGTIFITRRGSEARRQQALLEDRLHAGHRLLFFPEGTSSDALRVLPFKSTLFQAFFAADEGAPAGAAPLCVQPVSVVYHAPPGSDPRFYGWWGDMDFAGSLLRTLAAPHQGRVEVSYLPPVRVAAFADRKALARYCEDVIRDTHQRQLAIAA